MSEAAVIQDATKAVTTLVEELAVALVNARIFGTRHKRSQDSLERVLEVLREELADHPGGALEFLVVRDFLVYQGRPLLGLSRSRVGPA